MKAYTSDEGLKKSWDNVQKMVRTGGQETPPPLSPPSLPQSSLWDVLSTTDITQWFS